MSPRRTLEEVLAQAPDPDAITEPGIPVMADH